VGGLILITNARTMFDAYDVASDVRNLVYLALAGVWVAAVWIVVRRQRSAGEPLLNRGGPPRVVAEESA
jgi:hypothetical protein